jgi:uncharacterized membrane protein
VNIKTLIQALAAVLVFLFALGGGGCLFVAALLKLAAGQSELAKTVIAASGTVLAAVITLVAGKLWEQRVKIRDEIRAKKIPIYERHVATFFKILFSQKISRKPPNQQEMVAAFAAFSEHAIIWGSVDVIRASVRYRCLDHATTTPQEQLAALEHLFLAIRRDVGSEVRRLEEGELFRLFVNDNRKTSPTTTDGRRLP